MAKTPRVRKKKFDAPKFLAECANRELNAKLPPRERTVTMPPGLPEFTLGYTALGWMETNLRVPSGKYAGEPFRASLDQALFLLWWYALDSNGDWLYRRGVRRLAKGSGKSPFAAALALFELVGECRFDRFDNSAPGGVIGKPVSLPVVQLAAVSEAQTGVTMRLVVGMANKRTEICKKYSLEVGRTYIYTPSGGRLQLLTSSATSAEGAEPSLVIADEVEHWVPSSGGVDMWATLRRNLGKSGSRMLETCNAWIPGQESVAEKSFDEWCLQEEGKLRGSQRVLYDARVAPGVTALTGEAGVGEIPLMEALRFVYEPCPWAALDSIQEEIWSPTTPVSVSRRFYLNQPNAAQDTWVTIDEWGTLADTSRELVDGEEVVLFFDGSKSNDNTALVGCCMADGFVFTVGVWEPEEKTGVVNTRKVDAAVRRTFERFTVVAFWGDVREWESFVKVSWPDEFGENLLVPAQEHGKAAALIAWDMRSHGYEFAVASEECRAEIENKSFRHDGNWDTSRHIGNCRETERRGFITVRKESPKSPNKIDAAVCVIGARMVYRSVLNSPQWEQYTDSGGDWLVF